MKLVRCDQSEIKVKAGEFAIRYFWCFYFKKTWTSLVFTTEVNGPQFSTVISVKRSSSSCSFIEGCQTQLNKRKRIEKGGRETSEVKKRLNYT